MSNILMLAESFLISLALGAGIFSPLASTKMTGAGFIKLLTSVCLGSTIIALILHLTYASFGSPESVLLTVSSIVMILTYLFHKDQKSPLMWGAYLIQNLTLAKALMVFHNNAPEVVYFFFGSTILLGVITYAMILGHWYLVTPRLSEKPLKYANIILWFILAIKMTHTGMEVAENWKYFESGTRLGEGYTFNWLMLTMRVVWGYLVILVMSIFNWKLVVIRSTQSATGMLYAMTFFVLVGELISSYIYFEMGLFI